MSQQEDKYPTYPIYRGLQRPMEFMGFQGRYIYWAAATIGITILGFMFIYVLFGFLIGLGFVVVSFSSGAAIILLKQRKGLHTKKEDKGIFVFASSKRL